ncbi:high nitrogen upregulated cytochrome P450 monooxygenase 2 [Dendrothele bispora CBS 962.96]|uniref:High nitrogen upregulated cytochrome P450 monooxygenase 2 n=1 Tax=Dendrothele bispora (strain CBS 962.96) TaxID=1314807 RepID=A0A4S8L758_DENBC|nr:high nitrogen upregulated cytochrome P450 monooxygenase 2 [Dendrothele bispora CBS 962.96]
MFSRLIQDWLPLPEVPFAVLLVTVLATHLWLRDFEPPSHSSAPFIALILIPAITAYTLFDHAASLSTAISRAYLSFYTGLAFTTVAYRLSPWHPLARYPGPMIARISKLWTVWKAIDGKLPQYYQQLHAQYGSIVRIGPNELSITDKDLLPDILGTHGMPKGPVWDGRRMTPRDHKQEYNLILTRSTTRHAQLRKAWNKAFAADPLLDYKEILLEKILVLQSRLEDMCRENPEGKANVNMTKWIEYFSFDLMSDLAFGAGSDMLRDGDKNGFLEKLGKGIVLPSFTGYVPWFTQIALRLFPTVSASTLAIGAFAVERSKIRSSQAVTKKDLFYHIADHTYKDENTSPFPLIVSNAVLAILAGSDTTSSVLCNVVYYLLANPEYLKILQQELNQAFPSLQDGTMPLEHEVLTELPWLNAIINETMRLQPILPTGLQRAPEKGSGGKMVGSHFIKEGTAIQVPIYVLHRDPRYFSPNPEKFWPERWIQYRENPEIVLNLGVFIPFSMGPANCVGRPLAMMELRYVIAMLIGCFEMRFKEGWDERSWEKELKDRFMLTKGELMVEIKMRKK